MLFPPSFPTILQNKWVGEEMEKYRERERHDEEKLTSRWLEGANLQGILWIILYKTTCELPLQRNVYSTCKIFFQHYTYWTGWKCSVHTDLIDLWVMASSSFSQVEREEKALQYAEPKQDLKSFRKYFSCQPGVFF